MRRMDRTSVGKNICRICISDLHSPVPDPDPGPLFLMTKHISFFFSFFVAIFVFLDPDSQVISNRYGSEKL